MTGRERILMLILITVVGGGSLVFGVVYWFIKPLAQYNATIATLQTDISNKQFEIDAFHVERRKLVLARAKSLPTNGAAASGEYLFYLSRIMGESGLVIEDISPSPAAKMKFQSKVPGIKEVGHQLMTYTVRARGDLKSLVAAMDTMQTTPYEHRIKTLSVDRADMKRESTDHHPKLHINMVIETLLVAQSNAKAGLPPGFSAKYIILDSLAAQGGAPGGWGMLGSLVAIKASMPTPERRSYYQIAEKNIFTGKVPKEVIDTDSKPQVRTFTRPVEVDPPSGPYMPQFVYLTQTEPDLGTAYYKNRLARLEKRIESNPQSGRQQFQIKDAADEFVYVKAKVLRVDLRVVYIQKEKSIYAWHIGTTLQSALENSLDIDQRDVLELEIDQDFAKGTTPDTAKEKSSKKTGGRAPTKGGNKGGR